MRTLGELKIEAARRPLDNAYWHNRFPDAWSPTGFRSTSTGTTDTSRFAVEQEVDAATAAELLRISRGADAALHAVLTAGVITLLHLHTGEERLSVGTPIRRVPDRRAEPVTHMLPLRFDVARSNSLSELVTNAAGVYADASRHQDYPLRVLGEQRGFTADAHGNPFFDVAVALPGFTEELPVGQGATPVTFELARAGAELTLRTHCASALFDTRAAEQLNTQLLRVLDQLAGDPQTTLEAVTLRGAEDDAWLASVTAEPVAFDDTVRVHEVFERTAAAHPARIAVVDTGTTYGELNRAANRLARSLRIRGVGPDVIVAVMAKRSVSMLTAVLAVLKAGGAYLPIDPAYPRTRVEYLLEDSGADLLIGDTEFLGDLPASVTGVDADAHLPEEDDDLPATGSASDLAYVIYTSGSTGLPKGVAVEHRSVINRLTWMQRAYPIGPDDVILQKTSASFDVSVWELFWWAFAGAAVCLLPPGAEKDPGAIVDAIRRHRVTTVHFVPSMLSVFLEYAAGADELTVVDSVRRVFASGEALPPALVRRFHSLLDGPALVNLYGPTEATVDVSFHDCDDPAPDVVPIGRAIDNIRLYVVDDHLRLQPAGVPGELCIAGVGLARGYLHREELTAERFVAAPFDRDGRMYRTGDRARWLADGSVEYLGRLDHQVKIRGFRIEPGEVEQALRDHPAVRDAVVVARQAPEAQAVLHGYVVAGSAVGEAELAQALSRVLPEHMVPARIVVLDAMPLLPNGKIDRAALPEPSAATPSARDFVTPREGVESLLAAIWCEVLGIEQISAHENFFAAGGDSIHFIVVLNKARAAGLHFTFQEFFGHPTISELAAHLRSRPADQVRGERQRSGPFELISAADRALLPPDVEDAYPLSMLQTGLIYQSEIMRGTAQYHDVISYLIQSPFEVDLFSEAVRLLTLRNPILRTTYHLDGYSEYLQIVHRDVPLPLSVNDLRDLDETTAQQWYDQWLAKEKGRAFDWATPGTLITLHVQILRDDLYRYSISLHNSALDGWSINLVHAEVFDLCYRLRDGLPVPPNRPDNHERNFVGLEKQSLVSTVDKEFWTGVLTDRPLTSVPVSMPEGGGFAVVMSYFDIPLELSGQIVALAESLEVPVKNVLMAAHQRVLGMVNGSTDVMTGYEHSGRPELEGADRAMGMFLNTVPFRTSLDGGTWVDLIRQVYRSELDFLPHRRYPMAQMKQDLAVREGLFDTTFNFTHFYSLKELKRLPEFDLLNVQVQAETEFILRAEFSRHFFHDNVRLSLHYYANVISAEQAARLGGYYIRALDEMTRAPENHYSALSLLSDEELKLVVDGYAQGASALSRFTAEKASRVYVLDGGGQPTPVGTTGSILVSHPARPAEREDPWCPGNSLADTGRSGRWDFDGELEIYELPSREETGPAEARGTTAFVAPSTDTERAIAGVWSAVLNRPVEQISATDSFFELGGNSLAALRVVMQLRGKTKLIDVMRHPRLGELAALVDGPSATATDTHLRLLTPTTGTPSATVICFPYAAGHAINYLPLADAVTELDPSVALYGVELPGHDPNRPDEPFQDVRTVAGTIADEITAAATGPMVIWGHCGGANAAVETAHVLCERGADVQHVFVGAKLFLRTANATAAMELARTMTDTEIIEWLTERAGFSHADGLDPTQVAFICTLFRHDVESGHQYNLDAHADPDRVRLPVPLTFVGAGDDIVTRDYPQDWALWGHVAPDVRLREFDHGGHYFVRTRAHDVAVLLREAFVASTTAPGKAAE